jgi:hepatitis B virus X-interacting protein
MDEEALPTAHLPSSPVTGVPIKEDIKGMSRLLAERMAEGGGVLCNDQNGLCLGFRGDIDASRSGIYTSIAKLASQLDSTVDGSGGGNNSQDVPLISIQTEKSALLVKEYGERTVVFRVPAEIDKTGAAGDGRGVQEGQGGDDKEMGTIS